MRPEHRVTLSCGKTFGDMERYAFTGTNSNWLLITTNISVVPEHWMEEMASQFASVGALSAYLRSRVMRRFFKAINYHEPSSWLTGNSEMDAPVKAGSAFINSAHREVMDSAVPSASKALAMLCVMSGIGIDDVTELFESRKPSDITQMVIAGYDLTAIEGAVANNIDMTLLLSLVDAA